MVALGLGDDVAETYLKINERAIVFLGLEESRLKEHFGGKSPL